MIEETAVVSRIVANQAWVRAVNSNACGHCRQQDSCSTSLLDKYIKRRELPVDTDLNLQQGDTIIVGIDERQLLSSSIIVYILPLLGLLIGALLGQELALARSPAYVDLITSLIAIAGFSLSLWLVRLWQNTLLLQHFARPVVLRLVAGRDDSHADLERN